MATRQPSSPGPANPQAIAHRGLHDRFPENTLPAFRAALDAGAEAIELDAHATRDGIVVVHHDPVPRGTAADQGLRGVPIAELTLQEVQSFELGGGAIIPRLGEVLRLIGGRAIAYVEIKGRNIEQLVARDVRGSETVCAIHAFDHAAIAKLADTASGVTLGVLEEDEPRDPAAVLRAAGARDLWLHVRGVSETVVRATHAAGGRVIAWTANSPEEWEKLADRGVDGICTDALPRFLTWRSNRSP
jgi:glycerophosphoryl diester phosphodiesterase